MPPITTGVNETNLRSPVDVIIAVLVCDGTLPAIRS